MAKGVIPKPKKKNKKMMAKKTVTKNANSNGDSVMAKLCPRGKAAAKRKFKVYPSAYA